MNIDVDKIVVSLDVVAPDAVVVEASAVTPSGIVTEAVAELPTQVVVISDEETPTVTHLEIIDYGSSSIECVFDVTTEQADEVVKGVLCGTENPPTFDNADYRLLHGQGSMDLAFAGLQNNTEYYLRPYALSNLGYKYGDVVAQRTSASPIPSEYQLVEYLESTGTQYINTLFKFKSQNIRYEFEFLYNSFISSRWNLPFGSQTMRNFNLCTIYIGRRNTGQDVYRAGIEYPLLSTYTTVNIKYFYWFDFNENKVGINNSVYNFSSVLSNQELDLFLFAVNEDNAPNYLSVGRLYTYKVKDLESMEYLQNLYPVYRKADNKPGMYDIVGKQFYTNSGTGEFTVGSDKEWEE